MTSAHRSLAAVVRKELYEIARDGRFRLVALTTLALLMVSLAFGLRQSAAVQAERQAAQAEADEHFLEQDEKNPHVAAHYGTYVFKPSGALSFIDPGVDPFVGTALKLEAHRRNAPEGARAADATSLSRVGQLSIASVLQLLMPLVVLGLGFSAWTAERERGTLRLLAVSGAGLGTLFAGKLLGLGGALMLLLGPALALGGLVILLSDGGAPGARLIALVSCYAAYLALFLALTLFVSARAASSRGALVALLGGWVLVALVLPRALADVAARVAPLPSPALIESEIRANLANGLPGSGTREERVGVITDELLEREGFKGAETLMDASLLSSLELQAEAQFENEVLDFHHRGLDGAQARQEKVLEWLSVAAPTVAMRSLSSALAGTDGAHHRHFNDASEAYRRSLIDMLNRELGKSGGDDAWAFKAGRETWQRAPRFAYERPTLSSVLRERKASLAVLGGWLLAAIGLAAHAAKRVRVV
jgi:ABC-2 type transport system permease protein